MYVISIFGGVPMEFGVNHPLLIVATVPGPVSVAFTIKVGRILYKRGVL